MALRQRLALGLSLALMSSSAPAFAAPPSGPHPRLFMTPANVDGFKKNVAVKGTSAAALVAQCQDAIATPKDYDSRGGSDGDNWPRTAVDCAFAYRATQDAQYLAAALKYWHAALDDDQALGDHLGCVVGVDPNWQASKADAPPVIITVTHDTGYPMRWYGPDIALTYDWLFDAPGVDDGLRGQTRTCLGAWVDWYTASGYLRDQAGGNYNAGFVIAKVLAGIAIGNDGGADGHIWNESGTLLSNVIIAKGLAGSTAAFGTPAGPMVGGDWAEGWQYGPLSVLELAVAARALEENGVPLPEMDAWTNSLPVRLAYATVPSKAGSWAGGSFDDDTNMYVPLNVNMVDAVLAGPSSDAAAGWAASIKQQGKSAGDYTYNAIAELRAVKPQEFQTQTPPPALWYLARGTRAMYARTAWDAAAYWGVFSSAPQLVADHQHNSASNFVLTRGGDHLIVDPTNYGEGGATLESNAIAADSTKATSDHGPSQPDSSKAELTWARGTADAVYAARSDLSNAFLYGDTSEIKYAHREWVMLPEGEVITIDRVHTAGAAQLMYVGFHTNTGGGKLALTGTVASGAVGGSEVAIHAVSLSGGTPRVSQPSVGSCNLTCDYPCGKCDAARIAVDKYNVDVPGPWAVAVHVIDALAAGEAQATTGSLNDDTYDPPPKQNAGVLGAAVYRANKQTFVVASSGQDGATGATLAYGIPAKAASRHVVFDAPEDPSGKSMVTAVVQGDRCVLTIAAGPGFTGHPVMFTVGPAAGGCTLTEATDVVPGAPPPGGGTPPTGAAAAPGAGGDSGGCGCTTPRTTSNSLFAVGAAAILAAAIGLRRRFEHR